MAENSPHEIKRTLDGKEHVLPVTVVRDGGFVFALCGLGVAGLDDNPEAAAWGLISKVRDMTDGEFRDRLALAQLAEAEELYRSAAPDAGTVDASHLTGAAVGAGIPRDRLLTGDGPRYLGVKP